MFKISDKYSVDDILNEIDGKKSHNKNISLNKDGELVVNSGEPKSFSTSDSSDSQKPKRKVIPAFSEGVDSLTAEIESIERRRFGKGFDNQKSGNNFGDISNLKDSKDSKEGKDDKNDKPKYDFSVTQILNSQKKDGDPNSRKGNSDLSITQILNGENIDKPEDLKPIDTPEIKAKTKPLRINNFAPNKEEGNLPITREIPKTEAPSKAINDTINTANTAEVGGPRESESMRLLKTVTIDSVPVSKPRKPSYRGKRPNNNDNKIGSQTLIDIELVESFPNSNNGNGNGTSIKEELSPEEKERLQKLREDELLEKELALEDPFEMIDGINPYDVKNIESPARDELISVKLTQDFTEGMSIDDVGGDNDTNLGETREDEFVKEYKATKKSKGKKHSSPNDKTRLINKKPENQSPPLFRKSKIENVVNPEEGFDITPVLKNLNESFAKKRREDIDARRTLNIDTLSRIAPKSELEKTMTTKLNIDYETQIIKDTGALPLSDVHSKQLEERVLNNNKKRKIRDFIFEDIEEGEYNGKSETEGEDETSNDDYDDYSSSAKIWENLNESHRGLKLRVVILAIITFVSTAITFVRDLGGSAIQNLIITEWFKGDYGVYANALVYANITLGVLGMCACNKAVFEGVKNLFKGKADCDSACSIPCIIATFSSLVYITSNQSTALIQQNMAHIYVPVALLGLMFNTIGKLLMITRAKNNFKFVSGDSTKYSAFIPDEKESGEFRGFTRGILNDIPVPTFMRRNEFLTDFLKNSYCIDWADLICRKLVPISVIVGIALGIITYFIPFIEPQLVNNVYFAVTVANAIISISVPFSIMLIVNKPLLKASKSLEGSDCVVMGFTAAQKFSKSNAVVVDASMLFPSGSVKFMSVKRCQGSNAINAISIDKSLMIAASLAMKSGSIMAPMFYDMISGEDDILLNVDKCVYEVNMGITSWIKSDNVMLGNREQMKHHGIDVPSEKVEREHSTENGEVVYLAVNGEAVAMLFVELFANPAIKNALWSLDANGYVLSVKTCDSLVTASKLVELFELEPSRVRILPFDQHRAFERYSSYTSRGSSKIACNGTFTSFSRALVAAKTLMRDMMVTSGALFASVGIAALLVILFAFFGKENMISSSSIIIYNIVWIIITFILQSPRRY